MKKLKFICITVVMCASMSGIAQQNGQSSWAKVVIQTNGTCEACKNKIEGNVAYEKGVKFVDYDLATSKVTIYYSAQRTSAENLRSAISKLGYTAKILPATKEKSCDKKEENKSSSENHDHKHPH